MVKNFLNDVKHIHLSLFYKEQKLSVFLQNSNLSKYIINLLNKNDTQKLLEDANTQISKLTNLSELARLKLPDVRKPHLSSITHISNKYAVASNLTSTTMPKAGGVDINLAIKTNIVGEYKQKITEAYVIDKVFVKELPFDLTKHYENSEFMQSMKGINAEPFLKRTLISQGFITKPHICLYKSRFEKFKLDLNPQSAFQYVAENDLIERSEIKKLITTTNSRLDEIHLTLNSLEIKQEI
jgi:hypothetical protein